jgi:hypothetical protein
MTTPIPHHIVDWAVEGRNAASLVKADPGGVAHPLERADRSPSAARRSSIISSARLPMR